MLGASCNYSLVKTNRSRPQAKLQICSRTPSCPAPFLWGWHLCAARVPHGDILRKESAPLLEPVLRSTFPPPLLPAPNANKEPGRDTHPLPPTLLFPSRPLLPNSPRPLPRRQELVTFPTPRAKVSNPGAPAPPALRLGSAASPSPGRTKALVPRPLVPGGSGPPREGRAPSLHSGGSRHRFL